MTSTSKSPQNLAEKRAKYMLNLYGGGRTTEARNKVYFQPYYHRETWNLEMTAEIWKKLFGNTNLNKLNPGMLTCWKLTDIIYILCREEMRRQQVIREQRHQKPSPDEEDEEEDDILENSPSTIRQKNLKTASSRKRARKQNSEPAQAQAERDFTKKMTRKQRIEQQNLLEAQSYRNPQNIMYDYQDNQELANSFATSNIYNSSFPTNNIPQNIPQNMSNISPFLLPSFKNVSPNLPFDVSQSASPYYPGSISPSPMLQVSPALRTPSLRSPILSNFPQSNIHQEDLTNNIINVENKESVIEQISSKLDEISDFYRHRNNNELSDDIYINQVRISVEDFEIKLIALQRNTDLAQSMIYINKDQKIWTLEGDSETIDDSISWLRDTLSGNLKMIVNFKVIGRHVLTRENVQTALSVKSANLKVSSEKIEISPIPNKQFIPTHSDVNNFINTHTRDTNDYFQAEFELTLF